MPRINLDFNLWPKQIQALTTPATELLFGGATEGGKSHLIRVALITWCIGIPGLQCVLIRKKYDDILKNHVEGPTGFKALLSPLIENGFVKVTDNGTSFKNGSLIAFQHCQDERQFDSAQGVEKHVLVIDEAPQIPERLIRFFRGWVRMPIEFQNKMPEQFKKMFPRIIYTGNPIGVSVGFFKRNFVKARKPGEMEKVEGFIRQYIPSRAQDNPSVDMEAHKGRLAGIGDEALAKALDEGDWDSPIGEFFPEWDDRKHVVPDFAPPDYWFRYGAFDWGTADPSAVYWIAVSDGESFVDEKGNVRWFPKGALIFYREWYICDENDPAKGARLRNEEIAEGILHRSQAECEKRMIFLTDSLPFQDRGGPTISEIFGNNGVWLEKGDTNRVAGWSQVRSRLKGIRVDSNDSFLTPTIFFVESCRAARDYMPALPRHKTKTQDAAEDGEATHSPDAIRVGVTSRPRVQEKQPPPFDTSVLKQETTFDEAIKIVQRNKAGAGRGSW